MELKRVIIPRNDLSLNEKPEFTVFDYNIIHNSNIAVRNHTIPLNLKTTTTNKVIIYLFAFDAFIFSTLTKFINICVGLFSIKKRN